MSRAGKFQLSADRLQLLENLLREQGIERAPAQVVTPRPDPSAPVPLTFSQSRFWVLKDLADNDAAYVISAALRVRGQFRPELFEQACAEVVRRHESLRTVFTETDGRPMQRVLAQLPPLVRVEDLGDLSDEAVLSEVERREAGQLEEPFDLATGPLLKVRILKVGTESAVVLLAMHHIVSDRWSMGVLMRELTNAYLTLVTGSAPALPALAVQYPDFAVWQAEADHSEAWAQDLAYWKRQLAGIGDDIGLVTDQPRPRRKSYRGSSVPVELPPATVTALRALAAAERVTPFMILTACFALLLSRVSENDDIVVGTPVANRSLPELEPMVGLFVNTLALRVDLAGEPDFRQLLHRVSDCCLQAYEHQAIPFERLVEQLQPDRSPSRTPIFQVMLSYQNVPFPAWDSAGVRVDPVQLPARKAEFDLLLDLVEDGERIWGRLEFDQDLFRTSTATALAGCLIAVVRAAVGDPTTPVSELSLAGPGPAAAPVPAASIVDRYRLPVPAGIPGELCVAGIPPIADETAPSDGITGKLVPDPTRPGTSLYRTGDRARLGTDGALHFLGRVERQISLRGARVDLDTIEAALDSHADIATCLVRAERDSDGTTHLVGYLSSVAGRRVPKAELRRHLSAVLPDYLIPERYRYLDEPTPLPGSTSEPAAACDIESSTPPLPGAVPAEDQPGSPLELAVARAWQHHLGITHISTEDNFFDLGGHSVLATKVASQLKAELGIQLPLRELFDYPVLGALADRLGQLQVAEAAPERIGQADRGRPLALSFTQQAVCLRHPAGPDDACHNVVTGIELAGPLDEAALLAALSDTVGRHEALRTRIVPAGESLHQVVDDAAVWPVRVLDLRDVSADERRSALRELASEQGRQPFDVRRETLVRGVLVRLADQHAAVILTMHHLVTDNWSYGVLIRDLAEFYQARATGRSPQLPQLAIQYPDFAAWQQQQFASGAFAETLDFWRAELRNLPEPARMKPLALSDGQHPALGSIRGFSLPAELTDRLRQLAGRHDASLFMVLMAAFNLLIGAHSSSDDVSVGFPDAGRERAETAELIGYFVNTLILRTRLAGRVTFSDVLDEVREHTLRVYAHRSVPPWAVPGALAEGQDPARLLFNLLNAEVPAAHLAGVRISSLDLGEDYVFSEVLDDLTPAEVDLALIMREYEGGLLGTWLYSIDRLDAGALTSVMACWEPLLDWLASNADSPLEQLYALLSRDGQPAARRPELTS